MTRATPGAELGRDLDWSWYFDRHMEPEPPGWLLELRALRSRVLFEDGRRPEFGIRGSQHGDLDPLDPQCAHIVVRHGGRIVGCVRIMPMDAPIPGVTERMLGREKLERLLQRIGADRSRLVEHGRWIVDPAFKALGTGVYLMASSFALAYVLGYPSSVATVSQDVVALLARAGARVAPDVPVVYSEQYRDNLVVLYGHQREFASDAIAQFARMARWLGLGDIYRDLRPPHGRFPMLRVKGRRKPDI